MYFNCKNCTDRKLGCHGVCEDYIKVSKERADKRKKDRMFREVQEVYQQEQEWS